MNKENLLSPAEFKALGLPKELQDIRTGSQKAVDNIMKAARLMTKLGYNAAEAAVFMAKHPTRTAAIGVALAGCTFDHSGTSHLQFANPDAMEDVDTTGARGGDADLNTDFYLPEVDLKDIKELQDQLAKDEIGGGDGGDGGDGGPDPDEIGQPDGDATGDADGSELTDEVSQPDGDATGDADADPIDADGFADDADGSELTDEVSDPDVEHDVGEDLTDAYEIEHDIEAIPDGLGDLEDAGLIDGISWPDIPYLDGEGETSDADETLDQLDGEGEADVEPQDPCDGVDPDDGIDCTKDTATPNQDTGECDVENKADDEACLQPGNPCEAEVCDPDSEKADPLTGCETVYTVNPCEDGDLCTASDYCWNGLCTPGEDVNCNDNIGCTVDACVAGFCVNTPIDQLCGDYGDCADPFCDEDEGCKPINKPQGTSCADDGKECTTTACNGQGDCAPTPKTGEPCTPDGNECTTNTCNENGDCGATPKTGEPCATDGNDCTTNTCGETGDCEPIPDVGEPCATDGNICTDNECGEEGACEAYPLPGDACDDGKKCKTDDTCDQNGDCEGTPVPDEDAEGTGLKCWEPTGKMIPHFTADQGLYLKITTLAGDAYPISIETWRDGNVTEQGNTDQFTYINFDQPGTYFITITKANNGMPGFAPALYYGQEVAVKYAKYQNCQPSLAGKSLEDIAAEIIGENPELINYQMFHTGTSKEGECITLQFIVE